MLRRNRKFADLLIIQLLILSISCHWNQADQLNAQTSKIAGHYTNDSYAGDTVLQLLFDSSTSQISGTLTIEGNNNGESLSCILNFKLFPVSENIFQVKCIDLSDFKDSIIGELNAVAPNYIILKIFETYFPCQRFISLDYNKFRRIE